MELVWEDHTWKLCLPETSNTMLLPSSFLQCLLSSFRLRSNQTQWDTFIFLEPCTWTWSLCCIWLQQKELCYRFSLMNFWHWIFLSYCFHSHIYIVENLEVNSLLNNLALIQEALWIFKLYCLAYICGSHPIWLCESEFTQQCLTWLYSNLQGWSYLWEHCHMFQELCSFISFMANFCFH